MAGTKGTVSMLGADGEGVLVAPQAAAPGRRS